MAKKQADSKAGKIRALLAERPDAKASEVVAALAAQKVKVSAAQVYIVKSAGSKSKGKPAVAKAAVAKPAKSASPYDSLVQAKKLADAMGGVDKAKAALDVLARLV